MHKTTHLTKKTWRYISRAGRHIFSYSQNWYHLLLIIATIVAGYWTYYIFIAERNPNAHLFMDATATIKTNIASLGDRRLVFLDVFLNNTGKRKIVAEKVSTNQVAYSDAGETIKYSCGVQIRKILTSLIQTNTDVDWFDDTNQLQCPSGLAPEIDLLGECDEPDGSADFWIEPSDQCHLGHVFILDKGDYLVKIHFIGTHPDQDFWSRMVYIQVN